jgi:hypothetical protein
MDERFEIDPDSAPERELVQCDVTGKWVSPDDTVEFQGFRVCAEGKEILLDRLRSGESIAPGLWSGSDVWQPTRIDASDIINRAWQIYRDHMGICIAVVVVCRVVTQGSGIIVQMIAHFMNLAGVDRFTSLAVIISLSLAQGLFSVWIMLGQTVFLWNVARGRDARFADVFSGGRFFWRYVFASIVYWLACVAPIVLVTFVPLLAGAGRGGIAPGFGVGFAIAMFLAVIATIVFAIMFFFYSYAIIDQDAGVFSSLMMSKEITSGNKIQLVLLFLAGLLFIVLGLLACLIGVFFAAPFVLLIAAVAYVAMTGRPTAEQKASMLPRR